MIMIMSMNMIMIMMMIMMMMMMMIIISSSRPSGRPGKQLVSSRARSQRELAKRFVIVLIFQHLNKHRNIFASSLVSSFQR